MPDEFSYSQKIQLFQDEKDSSKDIMFMMRVEEAEYVDAVLPIIGSVFNVIKNNFIEDYNEYCEENDKIPELNFIESQIEEVKVDFIYWIRTKCDKNK